MENHPNIPKRGILSTLREAVWVCLAATAFAWAANALSPRGLILTRNYFPSAPESGAATTPVRPAPVKTVETNGVPVQAADPVAARLASKGLKVATAAEAEQLFRDPKYAQGLIIFLDARDDAHYEAGHIPGAYQFDHYHAPRFLPAVLPACSIAEQVLVYCTGGDCEDSEFAAITLRDIGVKADKLVVYVGGFKEWEASALPVETGARNSGTLRKAKP